MTSKTPVILYVDDDQNFLDAMRVILEANGYRMIEGRTVEEGLRAFREARPDLIIVDLMMEEVDAGTRLARWLKAEGNTAPVYMLSSIGDQMNLTASQEDLGLEGVFQKPLDPGVLLGTLKIKLGGREALPDRS